MQKKNILISLVVMLLVFLLVLGCAKEEESSPELKDVTLKLKWLHQAQFAGNYVALEKGFYADEGINVNIVPFSFEDPTIDVVMDNRADFGITGADQLILARAQGMPLKAIAVIYKVNPVVAYSLKDSGIISPLNFEGKTIGIQEETNVAYIYDAMVSKLNLDPEKINRVAIGYDATELIDGTVDVSTGYITDQPHLAIEAGYEVNTILMADYGVNMYADVLFVREDTINENPEMVTNFLRATLNGWQYVLENEEESVDITMKYATESTKSHETYVLQSSIPLIHSDVSHLGWMEKVKWEKAQEILLGQGLLDNPINIEEVYIMDFLEEVYD